MMIGGIHEGNLGRNRGRRRNGGTGTKLIKERKKYGE
jgi:hypothetical protein